MTKHKELYPEIDPYFVDQLKVSELHTLSFEQIGNPDGVPILFLHGGPGVGVVPVHRQYFDPTYYRAILLDQRGAGKSTPYAELSENTTWDIVNDLELLRAYLGIDQWIVMGGSWGSTLALCYAIRHPRVVSGLILRGVFLARPLEIEWLHVEGGASNIYPDAWHDYVSHLPEEEQKAPLKSYYNMLTSEESYQVEKAATAWTKWEASIMALTPDLEEIDELTSGNLTISLARTECHFTAHGFFMPSENYILDNVDVIKDIPCHIVQGRHDVICPVRSAWDLHKAMPKSKLQIVPNGAHSASEAAMAIELVRAANDFIAVSKAI